MLNKIKDFFKRRRHPIKYNDTVIVQSKFGRNYKGRIKTYLPDKVVIEVTKTFDPREVRVMTVDESNKQRHKNI